MMIAISLAIIITVGVVAYSIYRGEVIPLNQPNNNNNNDNLASINASSSSSSTNSLGINFIITGGNQNSLFHYANDTKEWLTYHHDFFRTALDPYKSKNPVLAPSIHKNWTSSHLDGAIYAEPLVARDKVFVVTENNSIYSLDANTGKVIWRTNLGPPVPISDLPCGNIDPTGITGTPVIDLRTQTIFAAAFLGDSHRHKLFALDLGTGKVRFATTIDPPSSDPLVQQQRAALALNYYTESISTSNNSTGNEEAARREAGGGDGGGGIIVYVPFGGLFGDCGQYHGWIVAFAIPYTSLNGGIITNSISNNNNIASNDNSSASSLGTEKRGSSGGGGNDKQLAPLLSFKVPTVREGGIWAPSGPAIDHDGNIFVATGNGQSTSDFDFGNSVIKLSPELGKVIDWFAPGNWAELNRSDTDLGSVGPSILDDNSINDTSNNSNDRPTNTSSVFQIGKQGTGYVLRTDKLGGMDGQVFSAPVCNEGAYGGTAFDAPYLYVACRDGLVSLYLHQSADADSTTATTYTTNTTTSGGVENSRSDGGSIGNESKSDIHNNNNNNFNGTAATTTNNTYSSFTVRWHGPPFWAGPPIVADGLVWTVDLDNGELYAFDPATGNVLFHENLGHDVTHFTTPSSAHGSIFVPAYDRIVSFSVN